MSKEVEECLETILKAIDAIDPADSHADIADAIAEAKTVARSVMTDDVENLIEEAYLDADEVEERFEEAAGRKDDAIHALLDEVERNGGPMKFHVPESDRVNRAIVGLHDAVGRNL